MANNASELERLRNLVKELEEREVKLEGELLEYYGLKEQESDIAELQKQLKIKTVEIDMLNITINSLQTERKKLQEKIAHGASIKKELEQEAIKSDAEIDKKLKALKELEIEVVELRRKNKELQHEKMELTVKLDAAEAKITSLSNMTELRLQSKTIYEGSSSSETNKEKENNIFKRVFSTKKKNEEIELAETSKGKILGKNPTL
ncbi:hypothetical protein GOBAR_DD15289 [Gossypium barbadense]|nr:hypothetical protein GOBAR_DD15289 [Gossypium barbadense]